METRPTRWVHAPRTAKSLVWMASPIQFIPNNGEATWQSGCPASCAGIAQPVLLGSSSSRLASC